MATPRTKKQPAAGAARTAAAPSASKGRGRQGGGAAAVRRYLVALEKHQPKRGRPRTPKTLEDRIRKIDAEYEQADPLRRLHLEQRRLDLETQLAELVAAQGEAPAQLEDAFAEAAADYAAKHGITYAAWRRLGVPARVLRKAGVSRGADPAAKASAAGKADRSSG